MTNMWRCLFLNILIPDTPNMSCLIFPSMVMNTHTIVKNLHLSGAPSPQRLLVYPIVAQRRNKLFGRILRSLNALRERLRRVLTWRCRALLPCSASSLTQKTGGLFPLLSTSPVQLRLTSLPREICSQVSFVTQLHHQCTAPKALSVVISADVKPLTSVMFINS